MNLFTLILDFLKSAKVAFKSARADRAAADVASSQPLVDHADTVVEGIAGEIRKAGGTVVVTPVASSAASAAPVTPPSATATRLPN